MSHILEHPLPSQSEAPAVELSLQDVVSPARRHFLTLATVVGGAVFAEAIFNPARADLVAKVGKIFYLDPIVLNFALDLEELQSDFFARAPTSPGFGGLTEMQKNVIFNIAAQDKVHFATLRGVRSLRGDRAARANQAASTRPRFYRYGRSGSGEELLKTALDIKETGLFAYHGAVGLLKDASLLATAAAIAGVEGRHTAALRETMGLDPVPAPYEGALVAQTSGRRLSKYGFVGGAQL